MFSETVNPFKFALGSAELRRVVRSTPMTTRLHMQTGYDLPHSKQYFQGQRLTYEQDL
jgi:hypothetical protein